MALQYYLKPSGAIGAKDDNQAHKDQIIGEAVRKLLTDPRTKNALAVQYVAAIRHIVDTAQEGK